MAEALDLFIEVTDATGTRFQWDANQPARSRLNGFSFRTKLGEGFSDGGGQMFRRIDLDYPDLQLLNDVRVVGGNGDVAYEGRISAMPRELTESHKIGVQFAGYMAHAKDRPFREIYVDRDLGAWGAMSNSRKSAHLTGNRAPSDPEQLNDPSDQTASVSTPIIGAWASPFVPYSEAWYDAGPGLTIGQVEYSWKRTGIGAPSDVSWSWLVYVSSDDRLTASLNSGNLRATGPGLQQIFTPATAYRYAMLQLSYTSTPAGTDGGRNAIDWSKLAVYGRSGVPRHGNQAGEPSGVVASDVIRDVASRFCPLLNVDGVQNTTYVISHLAFKELTLPFDAFQQANKYHLWHLGVWDNRTLHFRPYNLTDYDWEIRTDDPRTTFTPQGPSSEDLINGIVVVYNDLLTGKQNILTPDDRDALNDTSVTNPWNKQRMNAWGTLELSTPTLLEQATQVGAAVLAERGRPKAPGTITVTGTIRDRGGNVQPVWKIRAGDTIAITNFPNDAPRLIHETNYDDETKANQLSVEGPAQSMDAVFDRLSMTLTAKGLSS